MKDRPFSQHIIMINRLTVTAKWLLVIAVIAEAAVVDLKDDTFDSFIRGHEVSMVEFYAPW